MVVQTHRIQTDSHTHTHTHIQSGPHMFMFTIGSVVIAILIAVLVYSNNETAARDCHEPAVRLRSVAVCAISICDMIVDGQSLHAIYIDDGRFTKQWRNSPTHLA